MTVVKLQLVGKGSYRLEEVVMVLWELHVAIREHRISKLKVATALLQDQGPQCSEGVTHKLKVRD